MVRKVNAGQARGGQELGEAALGLSGLERRAVQQEFVFGDAQQKRGVGALGQALLQLVPGDGELSLGSFVVQTVEANILNQYVQAVHECPRRGYPATFVCVCRDDNVAPGNSRYPLRVM